ncbi:anaerobic C4-dicarboxylate transporter family protein [Lacrimispora xylanisolvens]|uniref:anaerobic C4-dicarboxylate transporter family protein n=1 Tax=Lacrimispora xylanisolvens TaxID=384636 RepID=UPI003D9CA932
MGTVAAALAVIKKGKELADDPEFQKRVAAGQIITSAEKQKEEKEVSKEAKASVTIFNCNGRHCSFRRSESIGSNAFRWFKTAVNHRY